MSGASIGSYTTAEWNAIKADAEKYMRLKADHGTLKAAKEAGEDMSTKGMWSLTRAYKTYQVYEKGHYYEPKKNEYKDGRKVSTGRRANKNDVFNKEGTLKIGTMTKNGMLSTTNGAFQLIKGKNGKYYLSTKTYSPQGKPSASKNAKSLTEKQSKYNRQYGTPQATRYRNQLTRDSKLDDARKAGVGKKAKAKYAKSKNKLNRNKKKSYQRKKSKKYGR